MKKITIWTIECMNDSDAYDIRARTKKEAIQQLNHAGPQNSYGRTLYKRVYFGEDFFDMLVNCLGEWRGFYENHAEYDLLKVKGVDTSATLIDN